MRTLTRGFAIAVVSMLALTGCIKVEMNVTLAEDDTASGDLIFAMSQELLAIAGEEGLDELMAEDETFPNGTTERYESEDENGDGEPDYVGSRLTFSSMPLDEFDAAGEGLRIFRDGDDYVVSGAADDLSDQTGGEELPANATATMSVTFPGSVSEHNGELDGNTVTWNLLEHEGDLQARGSSTADSGFPLWIILVLVAVIGIGAGLAGVLIMSSKRKASKEDQGTGYYADGTVGAAGTIPPPVDAPMFSPADSTSPVADAPPAYDGIPAESTDQPGRDDDEGTPRL